VVEYWAEVLNKLKRKKQVSKILNLFTSIMERYKQQINNENKIIKGKLHAIQLRTNTNFYRNDFLIIIK